MPRRKLTTINLTELETYPALMVQLLAWKENKNRKPLILEGARQITNK